MKFRLLTLLICVSLLTGCAVPSLYSEDKEYNIDTDILPYSGEGLFTLLFDIRNKISLQLDMEPEELEKMQADYEHYSRKGSKSPIYRKADLHITITTPEGACLRFLIEEAGVRMKGNTSRTAFYSTEEGIYNQIHLKLSFQETFDEEAYYGDEANSWNDQARRIRKNRTFATLEKLDLRCNLCDDGTYLKEYFAYETYRHYGVLAPHTNLASFDWAGTHMGVYTINEPVDQVFLSKNLPKAAQGGDLYKCGWAGSRNGSFVDTGSIGVEDEDKSEFYAYDLKTNKKTSDHSALTSFIFALNSGNVTKEDFAGLVDLDTFLPYAAVSYLLGNPDDMRNNYNNFYVYFRADNGKAVFIPYDYDRCLGITAHWNPTGNGVTKDNPFTAERMAVDHKEVGADAKQINPVILYSVAAGGYYVREYAALLTQMAGDGWFTFENFAVYYEIAKEHYEDLTTPDRRFCNTQRMHQAFDIYRTSDAASLGNLSIRDYLTAKLETLSHYLQNSEYYASMTPQVTPGWYIRGSMNNWQVKDPYVMTGEGGLFYYDLTLYGNVALKVYHEKTDRWYGSECVAADCDVPYTTDQDTNILLEKGSYRIAMDPVTCEIYIETR